MTNLKKKNIIKIINLINIYMCTPKLKVLYKIIN